MRSPSRSPNERAEGYRRYLIAAGTSDYRQLGPEAGLPSVANDIDRVRSLFVNRMGYESVLTHLSASPTSAQLRGDLGGWMTDVERDAGDLVVFYYSGHGAYGPDGRHYLLTSDSVERNLVGTAVATEDLVRMLGGSSIQHMLVLVDTCYAGAGVNDLMAMVRSVSSSRPTIATTGAGLWFVAVRGPKRRQSRTHSRNAWLRPWRTRDSGWLINRTWIQIRWSPP